jgi:hypothetical protein
VGAGGSGSGVLTKAGGIALSSSVEQLYRIRNADRINTKG